MGRIPLLKRAEKNGIIAQYDNSVRHRLRITDRKENRDDEQACIHYN